MSLARTGAPQADLSARPAACIGLSSARLAPREAACTRRAVLRRAALMCGWLCSSPRPSERLVANLIRGHKSDGRCVYDEAPKQELVRRCQQPGVMTQTTTEPA